MEHEKITELTLVARGVRGHLRAVATAKISHETKTQWVVFGSAVKILWRSEGSARIEFGHAEIRFRKSDLRRVPHVANSLWRATHKGPLEIIAEDTRP